MKPIMKVRSACSLVFQGESDIWAPRGSGQILEVSQVCGASSWHTHPDRDQLRFAGQEGFREEVLEKKHNSELLLCAFILPPFIGPRRREAC